MQIIEELQCAVSQLSTDELAHFREWFEKCDAEVWDRRFEEDARLGKLDQLADQVEARMQKVQGLTHKTVYALSFSPENESTIYVGTFQGGIFKTKNGGKSWRAINKNLKILDIHALLVDPKNPETVYAGTLNDGVWMSENGGESWKFIGLETSQVWDMFIY